MNESTWRAEAEALRENRPKHILFLCVANSARSQIAEGIARSFAPGDVHVSSAGSMPSRVRPEAIAVLAEIGIDAASQRSKGTGEVAAAGIPVDAVVTLCAEEVCPVYLGSALRVHWGLPDPAAIVGDNATRLAAFRDVRDELRRRLSVVFGKE